MATDLGLPRVPREVPDWHQNASCRLVGVLLSMLREAHCACEPPDTGHRAPVIPLVCRS